MHTSAFRARRGSSPGGCRHNQNTMRSKENRFAESYLAVLRSRLGRSAGNGAVGARSLGRRALAAGLGAREIARAHAKERCARSQEPMVARPSAGRNASFSRRWRRLNGGIGP